jgi:hypothetical protein
MEMAVWYIRERFRMSSCSCVRELEELGRCSERYRVVIESCVREPVEVVRVFEEL